MSDILLDVKNLNIVYSTSDGVVYALNDANLQIKRGETLVWLVRRVQEKQPLRVALCA